MALERFLVESGEQPRIMLRPHAAGFKPVKRSRNCAARNIYQDKILCHFNKRPKWVARPAAVAGDPILVTSCWGPLQSVRAKIETQGNCWGLPADSYTATVSISHGFEGRPAGKALNWCRTEWE